MSLDLDKTKSDLTGRLNLVPLQDLSPAVQDYLKAIAKAELSGERATTTSVATELRLSAPSVTAMLKKLAELELVERTPYSVVLTEPGRRLALEALRHHRLLERYLVETLGLSVAAAHAEADRLEHALSEDVEARIDEALGFPRAIRTATRFRTQTSASGRSRGSR